MICPRSGLCFFNSSSAQIELEGVMEVSENNAEIMRDFKTVDKYLGYWKES